MIILSELTIKNFRCFEEQHFNFKVPNGSDEGRGLNIFIGENGNGKTSVLEAIEYLTQSRLKSKSSVSIRDFLDIKKKVEIQAVTNEFEVESVFSKDKFICNGFQFEAKARETKSDNLVSPIVFDNKIIPAVEGKLQDYELRLDVTKPWGASRLPNFQIVYFDKNRRRHISKGIFPSKLDDLIEDLNFQVLEKINLLDESKVDQKRAKAELLNINNVIREILLEGTSDKLFDKVLSDCEEFFDREISLDLISNLEPFSSSFFSAKVGDLHQLPISQLGSGTEMIFSLIFLYNYFSLRGNNIVFLIDEPELHLHPMWQGKLVDLLKRITRTNQVFVSTHSPYIFKNCVNTEAGLLTFNKSDNGKVIVDDARNTYWGHFPWSPSWGEINYYAYNLPTIDFHNELYGYLQEKSGQDNLADFDNYLCRSKKINEIRKYTDKSTGKTSDVTLCTYIRNQIHHPENKINPTFTNDDLGKSLQLLINCF